MLGFLKILNPFSWSKLNKGLLQLLPPNFRVFKRRIEFIIRVYQTVTLMNTVWRERRCRPCINWLSADSCMQSVSCTGILNILFYSSVDYNLSLLNGFNEPLIAESLKLLIPWWEGLSWVRDRCSGTFPVKILVTFTDFTTQSFHLVCSIEPTLPESCYADSIITTILLRLLSFLDVLLTLYIVNSRKWLRSRSHHFQHIHNNYNFFSRRHYMFCAAHTVCNTRTHMKNREPVPKQM